MKRIKGGNANCIWDWGNLLNLLFLTRTEKHLSDSWGKTQLTQQLGRWINRGDKSRRYWNKQYYTVARVVLGPIINEIVLRLCDIFMGDLLLFGFCISILHQKELSWIPGLHTLTCSPWVFHKNIRSVCALILFSSKIYMSILLKCSYEH